MRCGFVSAIIFMVAIGCTLHAAEQDVFLHSAFGWEKNLEKKDAKGTLNLLPDGVLRLYSPDQLLVRACSVDVPIEKSNPNGEEFILQYEGRTNFETVTKSSRGGMILLNLAYSDGTHERKLLGARFATSSDWASRRSTLKVSKKVKSLSLWCDLADVKGTFEIRNFRFVRIGENACSLSTEMIDKNIFGKTSESLETNLVSEKEKSVQLNSQKIPLNQKSPAPVIVSVQGKGNCSAYFSLFFYYDDGSREILRNGLIFSADDAEWTLRKSVFYPSKAVKTLVIQCTVPEGNTNFSFKDLKIENFGTRKTEPEAVQMIANPQDRLPVWIWNSSSFAPNQVLCLRQEFELPAEPVSGTLNFAADDLCKIFINGKPALEKGAFYCAPVDAAKFLKAGKNCIAAEVTNIISSAGFLMYGEVLLKDGHRIRITTGEDWKTGPAQGQDIAYSLPGYNDLLWENAIIITSVTHDHPWRERIDISRFLPGEDFAAFQKNNERIRKAIPERLIAIDRILSEEKAIGDVTYIRKNSMPFIQVSGHNVMLGAPYYNLSGNKPRSSSGFDRINRLNNIGFRVFAYPIPLDSTWKEDGSIDIKEDLETLRYILAAAPSGYLMLELVLDPPEWFVKKYPQEMIGYDSGRERVFKGDALKQPLLRPSMASEAWMKLCGNAMAECIAQIEKSPVGKRVVAYMPTYGVYAEWHYYGMENEMPDTSIPMLHWFRKYLKEKYQTDSALQKAWHDNSLTLQDAPRPVREQRLIHKDGQPYTANMDCRVPDFDSSIGLAINHCQEYFNTCVRHTAKRKVLVGNYSGYFFGMSYPAFGWHTGTPEIMNSDKMDFQVSPFPYGWRYSGQSGMPRSVWESYALHQKVAIMEADTRTHQSGPIAGKTSNCTADSIAQINREFCNAFTRGGTLWYYDFNRAWFDYPEYFQAFQKLLKMWNSEASDVTRVSEIAVVCDFSSVPYHTAAVSPNTYAASLTSNPTNELNFIGAPYDAILMEDLIDGKAPKYKFYVVLNLVHNTPEKEASIRKLLVQGAKFLFIYHPEWIGVPPDGVTYAENYKIPRTQLRSMAEQAGVHFYCDDLNTMVFACRGFVGAHRKEPGTITLKLRQPCKSIQQVLPTEKQMQGGEKIEYAHPEYGTVLFRIRPR